MIKHNRTTRRGFTLVEIIISILLSAIMVSALFSVTLTAKTSGGGADRRLVAGMASRQLSAQLKGYVTAYWDYNAGGWINGGNIGTSVDVAGPSSLNGTAGKNSWFLTNAGGSTIQDDCGSGAFTCGVPPSTAGGNCYALAAGQHTLLNYLPAWIEAPPYCARISYCIAGPGGSCGKDASGKPISGVMFKDTQFPAQPVGYSPNIKISVNWTEP